MRYYDAGWTEKQLKTAALPQIDVSMLKKLEEQLEIAILFQ
jgi:hypothetical protein